MVCALAMGREVELARTKGNAEGDRDEMRRRGVWMRVWISVHLGRWDPDGEEWDFGVQDRGRISLMGGLKRVSRFRMLVVMGSDLMLKGR